ncbi:MAG TPA: division/cell wall cluster transcriptional repressor MraZ [Anaerolineales bacterium]|nr:division/cell wall cluster transcriptional repressor MraZ [Anaerolineales bacterium]
MFLTGEYHHTFDDKFRLTVPSRFREEFAGGIYVGRGFDRNLMVLTPPAFENLYKHLMNMNILDPLSRQLRRHTLGKAFHSELDKSGRILIPQDLRVWAGLETNVTIVGQGNYFEVWNPELLEVEDSQSESFDNKRFEALNISTQ